MQPKKFFEINIFLIFIGLLFSATITIYIDPYFHYHKPLNNISYTFFDERYINDGIIKHFDYETLVIGTSMIKNVKTSQVDKLFKTKSIKVPFAGGTYREVNDFLEVALNNNKNIKYVIRCLDYGKINKPYDKWRYEKELYPEYLYDNNVLNDYKYWWNKDILFKGVINNLIRTSKSKPSMTFDEYARWNELFIPGQETVLREYKRPPKELEVKNISAEEREVIEKNIDYNVTRLAKEYPNIKFLYFITPYSIVYWDELNQKNEIEKQIAMEKIMIEKILLVPNIELYSFFDNYDLTTNLNNYRDAGHYMGNISDEIITWMNDGKYRLTKSNYEEYLRKNINFYKNYDYDSIFKENKNEGR